MKRWCRTVLAGATLALSAGWTAAQAASPWIRYLYSGDDWPQTSQPLLTTPVCLNATSPSYCPSGALYYGHPGSWPADLKYIPYASWVWDGGQVSSADGAENDNVSITKFFEAPGCLNYGELWIAADDYAAVWVNGSLAGEVGSVTDPVKSAQDAQSLQRIDIAPYLAGGFTNVITVDAYNGPGSFAACTQCSYAQNPAGVVFSAIVGCGG